MQKSDKSKKSAIETPVLSSSLSSSSSLEYAAFFVSLYPKILVTHPQKRHERKKSEKKLHTNTERSRNDDDDSKRRASHH